MGFRGTARRTRLAHCGLPTVDSATSQPACHSKIRKLVNVTEQLAIQLEGKFKGSVCRTIPPTTITPPLFRPAQNPKYQAPKPKQQGNGGKNGKFTGQRLDGTGLYYYNARYYDPVIGRFDCGERSRTTRGEHSRTPCGERSRTISADTVVQSYANPQTLNRYSYCVNNPLKYTDPSGHDADDPTQMRLDLHSYLCGEFGIDPYGPIGRALWLLIPLIEKDPGLAHAFIDNIHGFNGTSSVPQAQYRPDRCTISFVDGQWDTQWNGCIDYSPTFAKFRNMPLLIFVLLHEGRHAFQCDKSSDLQMSSDSKAAFWSDPTYREWDAYVYAGNALEELGLFDTLRNSLGCMNRSSIGLFRTLDPMNSSNDYEAVRARLRNFLYYGWTYLELCDDCLGIDYFE